MTALEQVTMAVIAKEPVPGRVKTRLCPPCSDRQAAAVAAAALQDTFTAVAAAGVGRRVVVLDGQVGPWIPDGFDVVHQRGDGLDERLAAAFVDLGGPALVLGMDTPQVTPALLESAALALCAADTDAVLGPSTDGGYWIIGLRAARPDALLGVPMSVDTTCSAQAQRLTRLGLSTATIAELCDVDTWDEALEVAALIPDSRFAAEVHRVVATGR